MSKVVRFEPAIVSAKLLLQNQFGLGIERREWLVEQHDVGIDRKRTRQRRALPLSAGNLIGIAIGEIGEPAALELAQRALAPLAALILRASSPNSTLCSTVRQGSSKSFCSMKPTLELGPDTSTP